MSRVRVWYDGTCDQIMISGELHSFAPRSLICTLNGGGSTIRINMRGTTDTFVAGGNFADFGTADGVSFETPEDAKAYLDGVFSRGPVLAVSPPPFIAGEPLSGQRVVRLAGIGIVRTASSNDVSQVGLVLGVTSHAADQGDAVAVTVVGPLSDAAWSFAPGPVFLGLNGALVQVPPASGFIQQIATATAPTDIVVERTAPIILAQ